MWKELKRQLRLLFAFSVSERRGVLLLLVLLAITLIVYVTMPLWVSPQKELLQLADAAMLQMQNHKDTLTAENRSQAIVAGNNDAHQSSDLTGLFPFDPNRVWRECFELTIHEILQGDLQAATCLIPAS